jgi:chromatin remodeling complex protein RSC6
MAKKTKKAASSTKKKTVTKGKKKGAGNAAFMAPMKPSASLAAVVGDKPMPRTEVVKKLWAYIRKHGLQDPKNKRNIRADANLSKVFGGKEVVSMFEMTKLVNKQLSATA